MNFYSDEKSAQIIVSLLKQYNIKRVIISPGTTNIPIVGSLQHDEFFQLYSAPDERSAAYMACGMAQATGEPVALSCTGATSSRNYLPGLTEAYYKKLPVIAITSFKGTQEIGHLVPQTIDRNTVPNDVARLSVDIPIIKDESDFWFATMQVNRAILATQKNGGGPAHINVTTKYTPTFKTKVLPNVKKINYFDCESKLPALPKNSKIAVYIGSGHNFTIEETKKLEEFCLEYNGVILCDHTSGYYGKYKIQAALVSESVSRVNQVYSKLLPSVIIHLGEISGDYATAKFIQGCEAPIWRVSKDGQVSDRFKRLTNLFEMSISQFLDYYLGNTDNKQENYYKSWLEVSKNISLELPELPFSNPWIAQETLKYIPKHSNIHFGILNSLRSWNLFELPKTVRSYSNVGGFGIDGAISTMFGTALVDLERLNFLVLGDLAFFYDMNVLGNRHFPKNIRILLINNNVGTEFKMPMHMASAFGEEANEYIAASGHYQGNKSKDKNTSAAGAWAQALGISYYSCRTKSEYLAILPEFISKKQNAPIIVECFTEHSYEGKAYSKAMNLDKKYTFKGKVWKLVEPSISTNMKLKLKKVLK